jgi:hypothetical protein
MIGAFYKRLRARGVLEMTWCISFVTILFSAGLFSAALSQGFKWESYRSERFGYTLLFPADVFKPRGEPPHGDGFEFVSRDGGAKLKVFAAYNTDNMGLVEYRAAVLGNFESYDKMDYGPMGQSWFVLSGIRGDSIYYQKVLFSCGGRVINAFALTYPKQQKREYDDIVTGIEKNFRTSSGPACYAAKH